jgi:hypothetical protein
MFRWWNLAKLYEKKAPKQGREKQTRGKDQSPSKQTTQRGGPTRGKGTTKNQTFHQSHEAYQLKKGEVNQAS